MSCLTSHAQLVGPDPGVLAPSRPARPFRQLDERWANRSSVFFISQTITVYSTCSFQNLLWGGKEPFIRMTAGNI